MFLEKEKLKHLFVSTDEEEEYCSFVQASVSRRDCTVEWSVPGDKKGNKVNRASDLSRLLTAKLVRFVLTLNRHGWSFGGSISPEDFLLTHTGHLRAKTKNWNELVPVSDKSQELDWKSVAGIIRRSVFDGKHDLPVDMDKLCVLLEDFSPNNLEAIVQHPALGSEVEVLAQFGELYMELLQIKKIDGGTYNRIVSKMPFCKPDEDNWQVKALANTHLEQVLKYGSHKKDERKKEEDLKKIANSNDKYSVYEYLPKMDDNVQIGIASLLTEQPELWDFVDPDRKDMLLSLMASGEFTAVRTTPGNRAALFRCYLDDLMVTYKNTGGDLLTDIRNNWQHLVDTHSVESLDPKPAKRASKQPLTGQTSLCPPAVSVPPPAPSPLPAPGTATSSSKFRILFKYFQVMHIISFYYPGIFSDFFLQMHKEGFVKKSTLTSLSYLMKAPSSCSQSVSN